MQRSAPPPVDRRPGAPGADRRPGAPGARSVGAVLAYFVLVFLLAAPFWVLSAVTQIQLMPGLPIAAVAVVCPVTAACIVAARQGGWAGGRALLMRAFDVGRIRPKAWWLPILLLQPATSVAVFVALRLGGSPVPDPQVSLVTAAGLSVVFFVSAFGEELGWSGFATEPLQARWGALAASLMLGAVWALWHYPALVQAHRSLAWIGGWTLGTMAARVIMVWLFNNTGHSVFGAAVFHAISNLCWQLFPVRGSFFDPRLNGLILAGVALGVVVLWGPATLSTWGWRSAAGRPAGR